MNERLSKRVDAEIDGEFVFHLGDALSTVRDVVDDSGAVIKSFEFDEYGNLLDSSGTGTTSPKTWIGGLSVNDDRADSGMFNMGHRNYAAGVLGRFISRDPIGHRGGLNLYSYGGNNPVNYTDYNGLNPIPGATAATTACGTYQVFNQAFKSALSNNKVKFKFVSRDQIGKDSPIGAGHAWGQTLLYRMTDGEFVVRVLIDKDLSKRDKFNVCMHETVHVLYDLKWAERGPEGEISQEEILTGEANAWLLSTILGTAFGADDPELQTEVEYMLANFEVKGYEMLKATVGLKAGIDPSGGNVTVQKRVKGNLKY